MTTDEVNADHIGIRFPAGQEKRQLGPGLMSCVHIGKRVFGKQGRDAIRRFLCDDFRTLSFLREESGFFLQRIFLKRRMFYVKVKRKAR